MKKNTFKILFHIRGNLTNKDGKASIIARIAINGEYERVSTLLTFWPLCLPTGRSHTLYRIHRFPAILPRRATNRTHSRNAWISTPRTFLTTP